MNMMEDVDIILKAGNDIALEIDIKIRSSGKN
jgi:hypothetical protein